MGSGGGGPGYAPGGRGGGKVVFSAPTVTVSGVVLADGGQGGDDGCMNGAGGSGDGVLLLGDSVVVTGILSAAGGDDGAGFCEQAGGGGGGRVKVYGATLDLASATVDVSGGAGYQAGVDGTYFHPETTPPTSTITSPAGGGTYRTAPTISGTMSDDVGPDYVDVRLVRDADGFSWDGAGWVAAETWVEAAGRPSWTLTAAPAAGDYSDGGYTVISRATDAAGNVESAPLSTLGFTWDATPPTGTLAIDEGSTTAATTIHLSIGYGDAVEMKISGDVYDDASTFQWIAAATALTIDLTPVTGVHDVVITFKDAVGNVGGDQTATTDYETVWTATTGSDHSGADWTLSAGDVIAGTHDNVGVFTVPAGAAVTVAAFDGTDYGALVINASEIHVLGTINAVAVGYASETGAGAGTNGGATPCGAGYGGTGGQGKDLGGAFCVPGAPYGLAALESVPWSANDVAIGSGGGNASASALGGRGGGKIVLIAPAIDVSGALLADGASLSGSCEVGGGGSGGGVLLLGDNVTVSGALSANGGTSQSDTCDAGGGGGGGRVKLDATTLDVGSASVTVAGGAGYTSGEDGTLFYPETNPPTSTITAPTAGATVASPPTIAGTASDDTTVEVVEVSLVRDADGSFWDGGAWIAGETWLPADGRASWSFVDGPTAGDYANGLFTVSSRATDVAGNTEPTPTSVQFEWTGGP